MSGIDTFLGNIKVDATISMHSITILYMSYDCYRYAYQIKMFCFCDLYYSLVYISFEIYTSIIFVSVKHFSNSAVYMASKATH